MSYSSLTQYYLSPRPPKGCKGFCKQHYETKGLIQPKINYYELGWKRCGRCHVLINYQGRYCPCCGSRLSRLPGTSKAKQKLGHARY